MTKTFFFAKKNKRKKSTLKAKEKEKRKHNDNGIKMKQRILYATNEQHCMQAGFVRSVQIKNHRELKRNKVKKKKRKKWNFQAK